MIFDHKQPKRNARPAIIFGSPISLDSWEILSLKCNKIDNAAFDMFQCSLNERPTRWEFSIFKLHFNRNLWTKPSIWETKKKLIDDHSTSLTSARVCSFETVSYNFRLSMSRHQLNEQRNNLSNFSSAYITLHESRVQTGVLNRKKFVDFYLAPNLIDRFSWVIFVELVFCSHWSATVLNTQTHQTLLLYNRSWRQNSEQIIDYHLLRCL